MSTPTKFSLGGVPRTRTGLVPTTYTQTADKLSMPSHYQQLATKPKPQQYRYRGDFVNERNKKLLHERRLAEKHHRRKQYLLDNSNETDSLLVSPRSRSTDSSNELLSSDQEKEKKWDSYCQHISCHKLSNDEAMAKSENKKHFVSFLRSEAKNRKSPKKDKEHKPAVVQKKKKKPPVPRLSHLAKSGGKKGKENTNNQTTSSQPASNGNLKESDNKTITSTTTTKLRYLDFISEKQTGDESPSSSVVKDESVLEPEVVANSEEGNVDNDDHSKFRTQIERIVERAAQMVLKDNTQTNSTSLDESTADDTNKTNDSSPRIDDNKKRPNEAITDTGDSSSQKQRLELLEQQVRSMSSSTTDSLVFSSSTIDQDMKERYSSGQRDESISCTSSVTTEILPRSHVQPMSASLVWQQCFGSSSSSYTGSSYLTEIESSSTLLDSRASESKQYIQTSESEEEINDHSSCIRSMNETVTEVEPRLLSVQPSIPLERIKPSLETCPEETTALPHINPSAEPTREWEDPEPLPRGYERRQDDYQDTFDIDIDDIMPRSAANKGRSETLVDDLFSLL